MKFVAILIFLFCSSPLILFSQNDAMQLAIENYNAGDYQAAIQHYEQILEGDQHALNLYYNLGNCYYRNGNIAKAILNYERALLIDPYDEDVRYNLKLVQQKIEQPLESVNEFFLIEWKQDLQNMASSWTWAIWGVLFLWLGMAGLTLWLLAKQRKKKILGFTAGLAFLLLCLVPFGLAWGRLHHQWDSEMAIILKDDIAMKSAPDLDSETLQPLFAGYKVKLLDQIENWFKIRLSDGNIGWIGTNQVEEIKL